MVCRDCRGGYHEACRGHSWCDCQHKVSIGEVLAREAVEAEAVADAFEAGEKSWTTESGRVITETDAARMAEECEQTDYALSPNPDRLRLKPDRRDLVILVTRTGEDGEMYCTLDREQTSP